MPWCITGPTNPFPFCPRYTPSSTKKLILMHNNLSIQKHSPVDPTGYAQFMLPLYTLYITIMHLNILYICIQSPAFAHTDSRNSAALSWAILSAHSCQTMRRSSLKPSLLNSMPVEVPRPWMSKPCFQVFALRWMWAWMASCFLHSCYEALANPSQLMSKIKCICWHKSPLTYPQIIKAKMASVHLSTKSRFFLGSFNEVPVWIQIVH